MKGKIKSAQKQYTIFVISTQLLALRTLWCMQTISGVSGFSGNCKFRLSFFHITLHYFFLVCFSCSFLFAKIYDHLNVQIGGISLQFIAHTAQRAAYQMSEKREQQTHCNHYKCQHNFVCGDSTSVSSFIFVRFELHHTPKHLSSSSQQQRHTWAIDAVHKPTKWTQAQINDNGEDEEERQKWSSSTTITQFTFAR